MAERILLVTIIIVTSLIIIVGIFFYFLFKWHREWKLKIRQTPEDRQFKTRKNFIDHFSKMGYSSITSEFIYDKTQSFLKAKDLVLLPHDDLITLYNRQEDEWVYIINKWFDSLTKNHPDEKTLKNLLIKHKKISFVYLHDLLDKQV